MKHEITWHTSALLKKDTEPKIIQVNQEKGRWFLSDGISYTTANRKIRNTSNIIIYEDKNNDTLVCFATSETVLYFCQEIL